MTCREKNFLTFYEYMVKYIHKGRISHMKERILPIDIHEEIKAECGKMYYEYIDNVISKLNEGRTADTQLTLEDFIPKVHLSRFENREVHSKIREIAIDICSQHGIVLDHDRLMVLGDGIFKFFTLTREYKDKQNEKRRAQYETSPEFRNLHAEYQKAYFAGLPDAKKDKMREQNRKYAAEKFKRMTDAQRADYYRRQKENREARIAAMTPEEKIAYSEKRTAYNKKWLSKLTPEELQEYKDKAKKRRKRGIAK